MVNNKSKITLTFNINSDSESDPQANSFVWPNLDYEQVLGIEKEFIKFLSGLNDFGYEGLAKANEAKAKAIDPKAKKV